MINRFTHRYIQVSSHFKKSKASAESIEDLYDLIYEMERAEKNLDETIVLCELYNLIGLHIKTYRILNSLAVTAKEEKKKADAQLKLDRDNRYKNTRFYYRDLREARMTKAPEHLSAEDFTVVKEEQVFSIAFASIKRLNLFNKYVKTTDISIYSESVPDQNILDSLIDFIHRLSECRQELIDFYNCSKIEHKIQQAGQEWFDGLDIMDVLIEIKGSEKICCHIAVSDYLSHNLGFELEIVNDTIISIVYNPDL